MSNVCPSWIPGITAKAWVAGQKPSPPRTACSDVPQVSFSSSLPPFPTLVGHRLGEGAAGKTEKKKKGQGPKCNDSPSFVLPWGFRGWTLKFQPIPGRHLDVSYLDGTRTTLFIQTKSLPWQPRASAFRAGSKGPGQKGWSHMYLASGFCCRLPPVCHWGLL